MSNIFPKKFVGLHTHTHSSTFDGLGPPEDHLSAALDKGLDAHAITDHGHCNSFASAYLYAEKLKKSGKNIKYIPGVEAYIHPDLEQWREDKYLYEQNSIKVKEEKKLKKKVKNQVKEEVKDNGETLDEEGSNALTVENEDATRSNKSYNPVNRRHHLVILPKTSEALKKIFYLVSRSYLEGFYRFPRIDLKMLREAAKDGDIVISSACLGGPLSFATLSHLRHVDFDNLHTSLLDDSVLMEKIMNDVINTYEAYSNAVGQENMYLELQFNRLPAQDVVNRAILELAKRRNLTKQLIVTTDSHYPKKELWKHREMYKKLGYLNSNEYGPETLPKSPDELKAELYVKNAEDVWNDYQASKKANSFYDDNDCDQLVCDAIERTYDIAHNVIGDITFDKSYKYPNSVTPEGKTPFQYLVELCKKGIKERGFDRNPEYIARLKYELEVIKKMENASYFTTLATALHLVRDVCLMGIARGSAGGSLVAYVLKITDLNPIKYNCRFDRFLNVHRCLDPNTFVLMSDYTSKKIKDVKVGDEVISSNGTFNKVLNTFNSKHKNLIKITINNQIFTCSENHRWIVCDNVGRQIEKFAKDLTLNDKVYRKNLILPNLEFIQKLEFIILDEDQELVDITVENNPTFWVSTNEKDWILTHNSGAPDIDCLSSNHKIKTYDGFKTLKEIEIGDKVIDLQNNVRKVLFVKHRQQRKNEKCFNFLVLKNGVYGTIIASEKHKFFKENLEVIRASEIKENDTIFPNVKIVIKFELTDVELTDITVEDSHTFQVIPFDIVESDNTIHSFQKKNYWVGSHNCDVANRDLTLDVLRKRFGQNNIIPISNINSFKVKTLLKDISKFFGISYDEANAATRTVEEEVRKATQKQGDDKNLFVLTFDDSMKYCESFRLFIEKYPIVAESMKILFKSPRSLGRHAGGVVIMDDAPHEIPLIASGGEPQTPWVEGTGGKNLEPLGVIKYDVLGLETMRLIEKTIEQIIKRKDKVKLIELNDGTQLRLFSTQKVKTSNGIKLVSDLTDEDDILEVLEKE